ncbi:MAG: family 43 glycosylhydrolase [Lachnospirales bacterium]
MTCDKNNNFNKQWTIKISIKSLDFYKNGEAVLNIVDNGTECMKLYKLNKLLYLELKTTEKEQPLVLETDYKDLSNELEIIWFECRVELWVNGSLRDEEWPIGDCLVNQKNIEAVNSDRINIIYYEHANRKKLEYKKINDIQYWAPELGRHNVGDCMPFADYDTYHLFYLKDRHQHKSKWDSGAHQFAHISTKDMINWEEHNIAIEITHQWEGSICTGSIIRSGNKYYGFYAVRMADGSSAKISYAVSDDCINFRKSEKYFSLTEPYERTSVRDPEVFLGEDGKYHMLLTTDYLNNKVMERRGCLAHMTSNDLENWVQEEPFLIPGYTDQPECANYFEWNGWYYLIFSNYGTAKYRYSRNPFGPWVCPDNEILDGLLYRVPKTALFKNRRIAAGFLCINVNGDSYAGSVALRELKQKEDGTLAIGFVKELTPENNKNIICEKLFTNANGGYEQTKLYGVDEYIKIDIKSKNKIGSYGLIFSTPEEQGYEIRIDVSRKTLGVYKAHSCLYYNPTKRVISELENIEAGCVLEVILKNDILDICINNERTLLCRMKENWSVKHVEWDFFVKDGNVAFEYC